VAPGVLELGEGVGAPVIRKPADAAPSQVRGKAPRGIEEQRLERTGISEDKVVQNPGHDPVIFFGSEQPPKRADDSGHVFIVVARVPVEQGLQEGEGILGEIPLLQGVARGQHPEGVFHLPPGGLRVFNVLVVSGAAGGRQRGGGGGRQQGADQDAREETAVPGGRECHRRPPWRRSPRTHPGRYASMAGWSEV
jgi:hypothetical protein